MSAITRVSIRHKLYDYIRLADDKKLYAIYNLLEGHKGFVEELDKRFGALEAGTDKGFYVKQLETSIDKLRKKRYGK
jgi:hypothetical protein